MRRAAILLGALLLLGAPTIATLVACSCGPSPRPSMETCGDATAPASITRLEPITTADRGSTPITDGSAVPVYFGAQGGMHVQVAIRIEGTGFGSCIAQRTELRSVTSGAPFAASSANARLTVEGGVATTSPILLFPDTAIPESAVLHVEVAGQVVERVLGPAGMIDAGPDAAP